jgi:hypothetical protein
VWDGKLAAVFRVLSRNVSSLNFTYLITLFQQHGLYFVAGLHKREGAAGMQTHQPSQNRNLENREFVDIMISKVLRDLPFGRNHPLRSAGD